MKLLKNKQVFTKKQNKYHIVHTVNIVLTLLNKKTS